MTTILLSFATGAAVYLLIRLSFESIGPVTVASYALVAGMQAAIWFGMGRASR